MQPVNYTMNIPNPLEGFAQGYGLGGAIRQNILAERQAMAEGERQAFINDMIGRLSSPDATADDWVKAANILPPEQAKSLRDNFAMLDGAKQKDALNRAAPVFSALQSGNTATAINLLEQQATAMENGGDMEGARYTRSLAEMAKINPQVVLTDYGVKIGMMPGGKDVIESAIKFKQETANSEFYQKAAFEALRKQLVDNNLTEAQIAKTMAETRKLGLDANLLGKEIADKMAGIAPAEPLSAGSEKLVNDAVTESAKLGLLAGQYENIAGQIEKTLTGGGTGAQIAETLKKVWGGQDQQTALRIEYNRLKNTQVLNMLPPGVASDKDIEIAMGAFPDANASPQLIASFMRGMAKIQRADAKLNDARAEWVSKNGNLGNARGTFTVGGVEVAPGSTFNQSMTSILQSTIPTQPRAAQASAATPAQAQAVPVQGPGGQRIPGVTPPQSTAPAVSPRVQRRGVTY